MRPEEIEKVLGAYGYIPARQKGSHKHYLNMETSAQHSGLKGAEEHGDQRSYEIALYKAGAGNERRKRPLLLRQDLRT